MDTAKKTIKKLLRSSWGFFKVVLNIGGWLLILFDVGYAGYLGFTHEALTPIQRGLLISSSLIMVFLLFVVIGIVAREATERVRQARIRLSIHNSMNELREKMDMRAEEFKTSQSENEIGNR